MPSTVTVYYTFHPLVNRSLAVLTWPRHPANAATVQHPDGNAVKIPLWMLQPEATHLHLSEQAALSASALNALVDLLAPHSSSKVKASEQQEPTHAASHLGIRARRARPSRPTDSGGTGTTAR